MDIGLEGLDWRQVIALALDAANKTSCDEQMPRLSEFCDRLSKICEWLASQEFLVVSCHISLSMVRSAEER